MNMKRNIILFAAVTVLLSACATGPQTAKKDAAALAPVQPSYSERVVGVPMDQIKVSCPADSKWESLPVQKVMALANACVKAKDWVKVEKMGDVLAKQAYLTPWGAYYLSMSAEGRKDYPRAIWMLELALKKDPKEGLFHYELGRIHWELKNDVEALKQLKMASEANPSLTGAHWLMGQMAMQRQELSDANRLFEKALSNNPQHWPSLMSMAQLKMMGKDWVQAENFLNRAISVNPRSSKARLALARVQEEFLKKTQEALVTYRQIKQLASDRKLDENVQMNLDEKIQTLQKSLTQVSDGSKLTQRQPTAEAKKGPVSK